MTASMVYIILSILVIAADGAISLRTFEIGKPGSKALGWVGVSSAWVQLSYLLAVLPNARYMWASFWYGAYYVGVDMTLFCLFLYVHYFTEIPIRGFRQTIVRTLGILMVADAVVQMSNPFTGISISYTFSDTVFGAYQLGTMHLPYLLHLAYAYLLVLGVMAYLVVKIHRAPFSYGRQYLWSVAVILLVVGLNMVFLFAPGADFFGHLDYSIWGYSIAVFVLYWNGFQFSTHGMLNILRGWVLDNISQGVVIFDYNGKLLLSNEKAKNRLGEELCAQGNTLAAFTEGCGLTLPEETDSRDTHTQFFHKEADGRTTTVNCGYHALYSRKGERLGCMLVFTDITQEIDLLTGFLNWDTFTAQRESKKLDYRGAAAVGVCDINGLSVLNRRHGRQAGDRAVQYVSELMRERLPGDTLYVRGVEAYLFAIAPNITEQQMTDALREIAEACARAEIPLSIQYAVSKAERGGENNLMEALDIALRGMRMKKLLDTASVHSEMLTSLVRALEECDPDTEAHVRRTQQAGAALGRMLGLSDAQQSDLSLLCILHDIGKIGIPLDILNKPGRLSDEEWAVLRSHAEKGYQIAMSTEELSGIADMILHHHERWDGRGYPDGLAGEDIPILSRVIAVVDAYDAMVNDRSYRKALGVEQARSELLRCSGTQFDPAIVDAYLRLLDETEPQGRSVEHKEEKLFVPASVDPAEGEFRAVRYCRYQLNADDQIIWADSAFEQLTGYTLEEVEQRGLRQRDLILPEEREAYSRSVEEQSGFGPIVYFRHRIVTKTGETRDCLCCGRRYYNSAQRSMESEIIVTDIAALGGAE